MKRCSTNHELGMIFYHYLPIILQIKKLLCNNSTFIIKYTLREENMIADYLVKIGVSNERLDLKIWINPLSFSLVLLFNAHNVSFIRY